MNIKNLLAVLVFKTIVLTCNGQSYSINHFQSTYYSLSNYNSLTLELLNSGEDPIFWDHKFELGFDFPFFNEIQTDINVTHDALAYFENLENYNFFLFSSDFTIGKNTDTSNMYSEIRYIYTTINNQKALAIEYHNVFNYDELMENGENHTVNFQFWLFENGTIELRFGEIDLSNCSYYFPGEGFSFDNTDPNGNIYGPFVSINNSDITKGACFFGDHTNPGILYDEDDNCDVLMSIPPKGYVVQFEYTSITNIAETYEKANNFFVTQINETIRLNGDLKNYKGVNVYDILGKRIKFSEETDFQISNQKNQLLIVEIITEKGTEKHKIFME
ncbi:MAG: hypothetical protein ACJATA_000925 [Sphingobacteriales bacterium]|jgi:hypothetical protein